MELQKNWKKIAEIWQKIQIQKFWPLFAERILKSTSEQSIPCNDRYKVLAFQEGIITFKLDLSDKTKIVFDYSNLELLTIWNKCYVAKYLLEV